MCQQRSAFQHAALLISMGIFYKLQSLLEEECHLLDLNLALQLSTEAELTTASYEEYATAVRELTAYKEQLEVLQKGFAVSEGPFVKGVETALQIFNVHHQQ